MTRFCTNFRKYAVKRNFSNRGNRLYTGLSGENGNQIPVLKVAGLNPAGFTKPRSSVFKGLRGGYQRITKQ